MFWCHWTVKTELRLPTEDHQSFKSSLSGSPKVPTNTCLGLCSRPALNQRAVGPVSRHRGVANSPWPLADIFRASGKILAIELTLLCTLTLDYRVYNISRAHLALC